MSTIEIRKVTKQFGSFTAVKDADLKVEAGEGGAVQAKEFFWRHLRFDGGERFAEDEVFFAGMHHDVVTGGFDPIDVRHLHEARAVAVPH